VNNIISNQKNLGDIDIYHFQWVLDCVKQNKIVSVHPKYYIYISEKTKQLIKKEIDKYGDSYFEETSFEKMKELLKNVSKIKKENDVIESIDYINIKIKYNNIIDEFNKNKENKKPKINNLIHLVDDFKKFNEISSKNEIFSKNKLKENNEILSKNEIKEKIFKNEIFYIDKYNIIK
jgi:hypothetical protein